MSKDLNKLLNGYKSKSSKSILDCIRAGEKVEIDSISDIFEFFSEGIEYLFDRSLEKSMNRDKRFDFLNDGSDWGSWGDGSDWGDDDGCDCGSCDSDD